MSIVRGPRPESGFYILDKAISEDPRLGWGARGLLIFLLGKPDHWEVSITHLVRQTANAGRRSGRDQIYGFLQELESAGYLVKQQRRKKGTFSGVDYVVLDKPVDAAPDTENPPVTENPETVPEPHPDLPEPAEPYPANPTQVSIESLARTEEPARTDKPSRDDRIEEAFERFYSAGLVKKSKQAALKAFRREVKGKAPEAFADELVADIRQRLEYRQMGIDKLHPSTYLNQQRWTDELIDEREPWERYQTQKSPDAPGSNERVEPQTTRPRISHDGLQRKEYAEGATADADLPAYLRG